MEEFTDLRVYISLLLRSWKLIIGGMILAAITAFAVSSLMKPTYEATAVLVSTAPRDLVQFDPRFETVEPDLSEQSLAAYQEIATGDELLQNLWDSLEFSLPDIDSLEGFRGIVSAESGRDSNFIRLTVRFQDADKASKIVNQWAQLLIIQLNEIYFDQGGAQVEFFVEQLETAEIELTAAEQALVEFQASNRTSTIQNQLTSLNQSYAAYLKDQRSATFLIQDIQALHGQLATQSNENEVTFAEQLTALSLQVQAFDAQLSIPLQVQINNGDVLTNRSRDEQIAYLDELVKSLEAVVLGSGEKLKELEPGIFLLQEELQKVTVTHAKFERNREIAEETYLSLARKVEEEQITAQDNSNGIILASKAGIPQKPVSPRTLVNTLLASVVAGMFAIGLIFVLEWWNAGEEVIEELTPESQRTDDEPVRNGQRVIVPQTITSKAGD